MSARNREPHAESPLTIPLFARALGDPQIPLVPRAIDATWVYRQFVSRANTGFNPFSGRVYYARRSAFAKYLPHAHRSARAYNQQDSMMRELLFVVHDYLHAWSYALIRELAPGLDLGQGRITKARLPSLLFAHLLTEAVATVGLDYWLLAQKRLGDLCSMGTALEGATTSYRAWHRPEYRKVWPDLVEVQEPAFLHWILAMYVQGGARMSISETQMDKSALLARWIRGELSYSKHQRIYARRWFEHLGGLRLSDMNADYTLAYDAPWQKNLVIELALRTWCLVRENKAEPLRALLRPEDSWHSSPGSAVDFDLTNVNALSPKELLVAADRASDAQRIALCEQYVLRYPFSDVDPSEVPALLHAARSGNFRKLRRLLAAKAPLSGPNEPRDLMFYA